MSDHGALTGLTDNDHPQYLRAGVLIPARVMHPSSIVPAGGPVGTGNGLWPVYTFSPSSNQGVIAGQLIPASSTSNYSVRVHWCNVGSGSGDVRWEVTLQSFSSSGVASPETVTVAAPTAGSQYVPQTVVTGTVTLDTSHTLLHVRLWRLADHGSDTLSNDAGLIGISLVPV